MPLSPEIPAPIVPSSSILNAAGSLYTSAASAFASSSALFFTFCQLVALVLVFRGFYMVYELGSDKQQATGWMVLRSFLVSIALYYLQGFLHVLHNTFPGLFPNM